MKCITNEPFFCFSVVFFFLFPVSLSFLLKFGIEFSKFMNALQKINRGWPFYGKNFTLYSLTVGFTLVGLNVSYVSSSISCFSTRSKLFQSIASGSVTLESKINHSLGKIQLGTFNFYLSPQQLESPKMPTDSYLKVNFKI